VLGTDDEKKRLYAFMTEQLKKAGK
jgi:hypothetical protein